MVSSTSGAAVGKAVAPQPGDSLIFDATAVAGPKNGTNVDSTDDIAGGGSFQDLTVASNYLSTITIQDVAGALTVNGNFAMSGNQGKILIAAPGATSVLRLKGQGNWSGGRIDRLEVSAGATLALNNTGTITANQITNSGTINYQTSGILKIDIIGKIENKGQFVFNSDGTIAGDKDNFNNPPPFHNAPGATLTKALGGGKSSIQLWVQNEGLVSIRSGRIKLVNV